MKIKLNKIIMMLIFMGFAMPTFVKATSYAINENGKNKNCTIKTEPNENGTFLVPGKIHYLDPGDIVTLVDGVTPVKSTNSKCTTNYYNVIYSGNKGYVCGDYINFSSNGKYYDELRSAGFPESYLLALNSLKEQNPSWVFEAYKTGLDFDNVATVQSTVGTSYIQVDTLNNDTKALLSLDGLSYNADTKEFIVKEGSNWYAANKATIKYYLDPRNFLNIRDIFMFENSTYNSDNQTLEAVNKIFSGTDLLNHASSYVAAATAEGNNVSPTSLAARSRLEVVIAGGALSSAANGSKGYYNFFNIGSYSSCVNPVLCGNSYAAGKGWTTPEAAISGGAAFISEKYVSRGQSSLYLQKFNVTNVSTNSNQYMTNIVAPKTESGYLYKGYNEASVMSKTIYFKIPVFENMPEQVSSLPTSINQDDLDNANSGNNSGNNTLAINTIVNGSGFRYGTKYISNIEIKTTASDMISRLKGMSSDANIIITKNGDNISGSEILGTGDTVKITNNGKTETLKIVIYGDVDGDGQVSVVDLLKVQKHILNTSVLPDAYKEASDVNKDGQTSVVDLLAVQKHILEITKINQ